MKRLFLILLTLFISLAAMQAQTLSKLSSNMR